MASVTKKLPIPMDFTTENNWSRTKKKLQLHFKCALEKEGCLWGDENHFITETSETRKWLKIGVSAFETGKALWEKDFK